MLRLTTFSRAWQKLRISCDVWLRASVHVNSSALFSGSDYKYGYPPPRKPRKYFVSTLVFVSATKIVSKSGFPFNGFAFFSGL